MNAGHSANQSATPVAAGARRARPGRVTLAVGLVFLAGSVLWTLALDHPTTLGAMLGLVLAYALAAYYLAVGIARVRAGAEPEWAGHAPGAEREQTGWAGSPGRRSWRCALAGHKERFVARTDEHPPLWECRRCGAQSSTHLTSGHAWVCQLPVVEHRYDHVGATIDHPELWRCRRCGKRRFTEPRSAGETLEATAVDKLWIRRGDEM
jgi:ribosomal protein L37E